MNQYVSKEIIKAQYDELQQQVEILKSQLESIKEESQGQVTAEAMEKVNKCKEELLVVKGGQAVLIGLLNG